MSDEQPKKSLTDQAIEQARLTVTTPDGKTVDGKLTVTKTWRNGWGLGIFAQGKAGQGQKPQVSAGIEIVKNLGD